MMTWLDITLQGRGQNVKKSFPYRVYKVFRSTGHTLLSNTKATRGIDIGTPRSKSRFRLLDYSEAEIESSRVRRKRQDRIQ
jgi:hypothetical protein